MESEPKVFVSRETNRDLGLSSFSSICVCVCSAVDTYPQKMSGYVEHRPECKFSLVNLPAL